MSRKGWCCLVPMAPQRDVGSGVLSSGKEQVSPKALSISRGRERRPRGDVVVPRDACEARPVR